MGARVTTAKAAVVLLVCVGLGVARPFAAQDSAALSGTVTDGQGGVLPGATVTVSGQRSPEVKVVTDEHGVSPCRRPRARTSQPFTRPSIASNRVAAPTAAPASRWPTASRGSSSSPAA